MKEKTMPSLSINGVATPVEKTVTIARLQQGGDVTFEK